MPKLVRYSLINQKRNHLLYVSDFVFFFCKFSLFFFLIKSARYIFTPIINNLSKKLTMIKWTKGQRKCHIRHPNKNNPNPIAHTSDSAWKILREHYFAFMENGTITAEPAYQVLV